MCTFGVGMSCSSGISTRVSCDPVWCTCLHEYEKCNWYGMVDDDHE
jgi:hypothetical protein